MTAPLQLSSSRARRIALDAQLVARGRRAPSSAVPGNRQLQQVIDRLAQFQIDSINVVQRAHYLPLFTRLGAYDTGLLDRARDGAPRRLFEYWGHAASLIDVKLAPALRFRMDNAAAEAWGSMRRIAEDKPDMLDRLVADVGTNGPATARELEVRLEHADERRRDHWGWNWSEIKTACEWLLTAGRLASARRNAQFERVFDLPERVFPPAVRDLPPLDVEAAHVALVRRAAAALGVASAGCLADYFRTRRDRTQPAIDTLVASGELMAATVAGWKAPAYVWHEWTDGTRAVPRQSVASCLVNPFDPLIFHRPRAAALFGFDYTIEIYVPEAKRRHGYYVLPFLLGEQFAARVDLKADRSQDRLVVRSAWREDHPAPEPTIAQALAQELELLAGWLGLGGVEVIDKGDLAPALARCW
ncbi:cytoplasmic protein [Parenemella sanctibonifatiensis]|uniref:Cytoplasmic protein n=1 Tax=Parenemella sanctibonifatiensis TaxID=2016505 RepID=A0A255E7G9_9ACTN|nr:cytoplasmic protein [Parenemella sanctibonifatiensis]